MANYPLATPSRCVDQPRRCPVCGWRFKLDERWDMDVEEVFCARCESRLVVTDDDAPRRWVVAGIYT